MYQEQKSNSSSESQVSNSLDHFKQIASETNIVPQQGSYDSLTALFNRMNSFDPTLFHRLKEYVLNELGPKNQYEVKVFENYTKMLAETEMLIMCKKIKTAQIGISEALGEGNLGGSASSRRLSMEQAKEAEEAAFNDESLC